MNVLFESIFFFILGKGWKTIIRQCASRSTLGVAQGCRYFIDEVGLEVAVCVSFQLVCCKNRYRDSSINKKHRKESFVGLIRLEILAERCTGCTKMFCQGVQLKPQKI
jgi:hypothetical protein